MKYSIIKMIPIIGFFLCASSCHKDESYYCYHVKDSDSWWTEIDTLDTYSQGFIYRTSRPEEKCQEEVDFYAEYYPEEVHYCDCGWEPD